MTTRMRLLGPVRCVLSLSLVSCTDAATRVAYDLEAGAKRFRKAPTVAAAVEHSPKVSPEGCPGGYTLQLSEESALLVWCQDSIAGPAVSSHTTTYHLNYVDVPRTLIIHKGRGQHVWLDLAKDGDRIVVTGLR
jgi:hypothetical protein